MLLCRESIWLTIVSLITLSAMLPSALAFNIRRPAKSPTLRGDGITGDDVSGYSDKVDFTKALIDNGGSHNIGDAGDQPELPPYLYLTGALYSPYGPIRAKPTSLQRVNPSEVDTLERFYKQAIEKIIFQKSWYGRQTSRLLDEVITKPLHFEMKTRGPTFAMKVVPMKGQPLTYGDVLSVLPTLQDYPISKSKKQVVLATAKIYRVKIGADDKRALLVNIGQISTYRKQSFSD